MTIQKILTILAFFTVCQEPIHAGFFSAFVKGAKIQSSVVATTKIKTAQSIKLYESLHALGRHQGTVSSSVYPLQQVLTSYARRTSNAKIYDIVLQSLSKNPEKLNSLISSQVAINDYKHNRMIEKGLLYSQRWAQKYMSNGLSSVIQKKPSASVITPVLKPQSTVQRSKSLFVKNTEPTLAQKVYYLAFQTGPVDQTVMPIKNVVDQIKAYAPNSAAYKKIIIDLCTTHTNIFQNLLTTQKTNKLSPKMIQKSLEPLRTEHKPVLTRGSLWSRMMGSSNPPTLAQKVYFVAYTTEPVSPSLYPLKKVTEQLKKQIPDPELYKQAIISLCSEHKPLLQKMIDTQVRNDQHILENQFRKGLAHSKNWLLKYNEAMSDLAETQVSRLSSAQTQNLVNHHPSFVHHLLKSLMLAPQARAHAAEPIKLLTQSPTKLLTASTQPAPSFAQAQNAFNHEINSAQTVATYASATSTTAVESPKLLTQSPTKLLTASAQPAPSFAQAQNAFNHEINTAYTVANYAPAAPTAAVEPTKLLTQSPTKLLTASAQPAQSFAQAQHAFNHEINSAYAVANYAPAAPTTAVEPIKLLTQSPTKLLTASTQPAHSFAQAQSAFNHEINSAHTVATYAPAVPTTAVEPIKLLTQSPTKLLTASTQPAHSFAQAQHAFNHEINSAQTVATYAQAVLTAAVEPTKLLTQSPTKLLTASAQPDHSFAQAQNAFSHEINSAHTMANYAPAVPTTIVEPTKRLTQSPTKLLTASTQPAHSFAQTQHALNHEINSAHAVATYAPAAPTTALEPTKLLTQSPTKLLTASAQPDHSFAKAQHAFNHEINSAHTMANYAPAVPTTAVEPIKLLTQSPTKLLTASTQPAHSFAQTQHAFNHEINTAHAVAIYAPAAPTTAVEPTKLLTQSPTKLLTASTQPAQSFAQAQSAFSHEINSAHAVATYAPVASTTVVEPIKLLTQSPAKSKPAPTPSISASTAEAKQPAAPMVTAHSEKSGGNSSTSQNYMLPGVTLAGGAMGTAWLQYSKEQPEADTTIESTPTNRSRLWLVGVGSIIGSSILLYKLLAGSPNNDQQDPQDTDDEDTPSQDQTESVASTSSAS